eukprot:Selendium_serpulae@DN27_c0_g1_i1.p1
MGNKFEKSANPLLACCERENRDDSKEIIAPSGPSPDSPQLDDSRNRNSNPGLARLQAAETEGERLVGEAKKLYYVMVEKARRDANQEVGAIRRDLERQYNELSARVTDEGKEMEERYDTMANDDVAGDRRLAAERNTEILDCILGHVTNVELVMHQTAAEIVFMERLAKSNEALALEFPRRRSSAASVPQPIDSMPSMSLRRASNTSLLDGRD